MEAIRSPIRDVKQQQLKASGACRGEIHNDLYDQLI